MAPAAAGSAWPRWQRWFPALPRPERAVILFIAFLAWNLWHHAMWRDEVQAWGLADTGNSLGLLIYRVRHEGHPLLWYLLLWGVHHLSASPEAMKLPQFAIGTATYLLIAFRAPLTATEKWLLFLNYYLVFEYTVVSRNYGLGLLPILAYACETPAPGRAALRQYGLLGLAANAHLFTAVLAGFMAADRVLSDRALGRLEAAPLVACALLFAAAALVLWPAGDHYDPFAYAATSPVGAAWPARAFYVAYSYTGHAFAPVDLSFPATFSAQTLWRFRPFLFGAIVLGALPYACLRRAPRHLAIYAATAGSCAAFCMVFIAGSTRHHGIMLAAFLAGLFALRHRDGVRPSVLVAALLVPGAVGGVEAAVGMQLHPFSNSAAAARWIERQGLRDAFWIGTDDTTTTAPFAYLGRPRFTLECGCEASFVLNSTARHEVAWQDVPGRIGALLRARHLDQAMVMNSERADVLPPPESWTAAGLSEQVIMATQGAEIPEEDYVIRRIRLLPGPPGN